jgi:hypothetical protein
MKTASQTARTGEDRALLSLANWADADAAVAKSERSRVEMPKAAPLEAKPAVSPLLAGLARSAKTLAEPPIAPTRPAAQTIAAEPTLFDLLKAKGGSAATPPAAPIRTEAVRKPLLPRLPTLQPRSAMRSTSPLRWLAVPIFAFAGAAAGYFIAPAPLYSARAELILKAEGVRGATGMQPSQAERPQVTPEAVEHSMARVASPEVLEPVVDRLGLAADADFGAGDRAVALEKLSGRLSAEPQTLTAGYTITAQAPDAALSGDIANAVADTLVETHDPNGAGPPPTRLELAFRAMPGTAGAEQLPLVPAGIGGAIGAGLGLALALAAGRRREPVSGTKPAPAPTPAPPPSPPATRVPPPIAAPAVKAESIVPPRPAVPPIATPKAPEPAVPTVAPRSSFLEGMRERLRLSTPPAPPTAIAEPAPPAPAPVPPAQLAPAIATQPSTAPIPLPETAMYPQHPLQPLPAYPQAPQAPAPWWQQAPAAVPQFAPAPHYAPAAQFAPAPQFAPPMQGYPHPAAMPAYPQPAAYYPPALPHPMAMQQSAPWFPAMQPQVHHIPVPVPVPYPVPMPMPAAAPVIQHEAPQAEARRAEPRPAPKAEPETDHSAETLAAIDEVRAQLRAFAGSLDALKAARSA